MANIDYHSFCAHFKDGKDIQEAGFYLFNDQTETVCYLKFLPERKNPYWVNSCDVPDGVSFPSLEELMTSRIFNRKLLQENWDNVYMLSINGMHLEDWRETLQT